MKRSTISKVTEARMSLRLYGRHFNKFFKYAPDSVCVIDRLNSDSDKLSLDLYSLPEELLYNSNGKFVAYYSKYLNGYRTLYELIKTHKEFDSHMVAINILKIVDELKSIGLNYFDLHDENFMIDKKGNFKVIDVDGCDFDLTEYSRTMTINNLWDLLFEIYLFQFYPEHPLRLSCVYSFPELDTYFSREFIDYIDCVIRDDRDILSVSPSIYLPEFEDVEKVKELSKRIEIEGRYYGR